MNDWVRIDTIEEAVEERIFDFVNETDGCDEETSRGDTWVCLKCISKVAVREARRLIADEINEMAVEHSKEPADDMQHKDMRAARVAETRLIAERVAQGGGRDET